MSKKLRIMYAMIFIILLIIEICIALFVKDNFVRPYIGDLLVTLLICSFLRIFIPTKIKLLPIFVFLFAALVELAQYFNIVALLGLEKSAFFSTIIGTTFSFADIICYFLGCVIFWLIEKLVKLKTEVSK